MSFVRMSSDHRFKVPTLCGKSQSKFELLRNDGGMELIEHLHYKFINDKTSVALVIMVLRP